MIITKLEERKESMEVQRRALNICSFRKVFPEVMRFMKQIMKQKKFSRQ